MDLKKRRSSKTWVDRRRQFYNKDVQKLIELYSTENEEKTCVIERFNRTIKEKMFKYFCANNKRKYVDMLVNQCNNSFHSSIKMTPNEVRKTKIKYGEIYTQN